MKRRYLIAILVLGAVLAPSLSFADDSSDDDHDSGNGGESGSDSGDDSPDSGDDASQEDEDSSGGGSGRPGGSTTSGGSGDDDDQEDALRAVHDEGALPLEQVLALFTRNVGGQVIDVKLVRNFFRLQYKFVYIDDRGRVRRAYFDAKTGEYLD